MNSRIDSSFCTCEKGDARSVLVAGFARVPLVCACVCVCVCVCVRAFVCVMDSTHARGSAPVKGEAQCTIKRVCEKAINMEDVLAASAQRRSVAGAPTSAASMPMMK
jgi:hypothetical protein